MKAFSWTKYVYIFSHLCVLIFLIEAKHRLAHLKHVFLCAFICPCAHRCIIKAWNLYLKKKFSILILAIPAIFKKIKKVKPQSLVSFNILLPLPYILGNLDAYIMKILVRTFQKPLTGKNGVYLIEWFIC